TSIRFERWIGASFSTMPPIACGPRPLRWRFTMLRRSTVARFFSRTRRSSLPVLPFSLPAMTRTVSPFLSRVATREGLSPLPARFFACPVIVRFPPSPASDHFRRERHDLHEALGAELASDRPEDARADRLALVVDEHRRVVVEADVGAVGPADLLRRPHHDRLHDVALLDLRVRRRFLDRSHDDVAERGIAPPAPAQHLDAQHLACAG